MPNIPIYELPEAQSKLTPAEGGSQATARAGRIIQETARSVGQMTAQGWQSIGKGVAEAGAKADDYFTQKDITEAAQGHTAIAAQAQKDLPDLLANSKDPVQAVNDYYENTIKPATEKINNSMMTKRSRMWAVEHTQSGAQAYLTHGMAQAQELQGARAITGFQNAVNNLGAAVQANPHALEDMIKQSDQLMDGLKGTLSATQQIHLEGHKAAVHQQLAVEAARELAKQNPAQFQKDLAAGWGKDYLDPKVRETLVQYAQHEMDRKKRAVRGASTGAITEWVDGHITPQAATGAGQLKEITPEAIGAIQADPNLTDEDRKNLTEFTVEAARIQKWQSEHKVRGRVPPKGSVGEEVYFRDRLGTGNPPTLPELTKAMNRYAKDPSTGLSPEIAASIAKQSHPNKIDALASAHNDPVYKNRMADAKEQIRGEAESSNGAVRSKYLEFENRTLTTIQDAVKRGEHIAPYLDPKDPKYLFKPEIIEGYKPTQKEIDSGFVKRTPVVPQKAGEVNQPSAPKSGEVPATAPKPGERDVDKFMWGTK